MRPVRDTAFVTLAGDAVAEIAFDHAGQIAAPALPDEAVSE